MGDETGDAAALALHVHHPEQQSGNHLCLRVCIHHKPPEDGGSHWFPSNAGKEPGTLFMTEMLWNHLDMSHLRCFIQQVNSLTMTFFSIAIVYNYCSTHLWKSVPKYIKCVIVHSKINVLVKRALQILHTLVQYQHLHSCPWPWL